MTHAEMLPLLVVAFATGVAATTDLWKFKVYNVLTLPTLLLGLLVSAILGGWDGLGASLQGAGLGFAALVVFYALGGVGAGDVKLMAAVGAWLGPSLTMTVFAASAMAAGLYAAVLMVWRGGAGATLFRVALLGHRMLTPELWSRPATTIQSEAGRADRRLRLVPFAAMICAGFFLTLAWWRADLGAIWPPYGSTEDHPIASASAWGDKR